MDVTGPYECFFIGTWLWFPKNLFWYCRWQINENEVSWRCLNYLMEYQPLINLEKFKTFLYLLSRKIKIDEDLNIPILSQRQIGSWKLSSKIADNLLRWRRSRILKCRVVRKSKAFMALYVFSKSIIHTHRKMKWYTWGQINFYKKDHSVHNSFKYIKSYKNL